MKYFKIRYFITLLITIICQFHLQVYSQTPAISQGLSQIENSPLLLEYREPLKLGYDSSVTTQYYNPGWVSNETIQLSLDSIGEKAPELSPQFYQTNYPISDIRNLSKKYLKENVLLLQKTWPFLQKIKEFSHILDEIIYASLESDHFSSSERDYLKQMIEVLKDSSFYTSRYSDPKTNGVSSISFIYDRTGEFTVKGTQEDRIALNENGRISFNLEKLSKLGNLTIRDVVWLLMHEIGHQIPEIDLVVKDQIATKLSHWVDGKIQTIKASNGKVYYFLPLGPSLTNEQIQELAQLSHRKNKSHELVSRYNDDFYYLSVLRRNFVFEESLRTFSINTKIAEQLAKVTNFSELFKGQNVYYGYKLIWPQIQINQIKVNSVGQLSVDFKVKPLQYVLDEKYFPKPFSEIYPTYSGINDFQMTKNFVLNIDANLNNFEVEAKFHQEVPKGMLILNALKTVGMKKYLSLKVQIDFQTIQNGKAISLVGRSPVDGKPVVLFPIQSRVLNQNEVLFHFVVPESGISVRYLQIPTNEELVYTEKVIRPIEQIDILGVNQTDVKQTKSIVSIKTDENHRTQLSVQSPKKIKKVMVEMDSYVNPLAAEYGRAANYQQTIGFVTIPGFAYQEGASITIPQRVWYETKDSKNMVFELPQEKLSKVVIEKISRSRFENPFKVLRPKPQKSWWTQYFPNFKEPDPRRSLIEDSGYKSIKTVYVYFTDGTFEKHQNFDKATYQTQDSYLRMEAERKRVYDMLKYSDESGEKSPIACKGLF